MLYDCNEVEIPLEKELKLIENYMKLKLEIQMNRLVFDIGFKYRLIRHLLLFLVTIAVFSVILFLQGSHKNFSESFIVTLINSFFFFGYAYIVLFLLIPEFLLKRKIFVFLWLFLIAGILLSTLKMAVSDEIYYSAINPENFEPGKMKGLRNILVNTKDMSFIVAFFCVAKFTKDYIYTENQREKLEIQNREARQRLLQSQLNPHFLYNTINNLYALSLLQPEKTAEITDRVQRILHYIIEKSRYNFVKLADEIALVENYISLEKLRYGDRLNVKIVLEGNTLEWKIPPMVLFFFAENCIKHGSSPDSGTPWITINIEARSENLLMTIENSKPPAVNQLNLSEGNRNGLQNLKKRLEILYPQSGYSLKIKENEKIFRIHLKLTKLQNEMGQQKYR